MNRSNLFAALLLLGFPILATDADPAHTKSLEERIERVEKGLVRHSFGESFQMSQVVDVKRIESLPKFDLEETMQELAVPGLSLAVIDDFKVAWTKGYGVMEAGTTRSVTSETMFQSGSTTKLLMAIVVLRMVEEKKLDLDTDINRYLESWKLPDHPSGAKVTLRLLLTHQSGINRPGDGFHKEPGTMPTLLQFLRGERPVLNDPVAFDYPPAAKHSYSNFGYLVMQYLLEEHFQTTYPRLVEHYVSEPLDLKSSFISYPFPAAFTERIIRPHDAEGRATEDDGLESSALAQAGMISTSGDWAAIASELMLAAKGRSDRMLTQASVQAMFHSERRLEPSEFEGLSGQGLGVFLFEKGPQRYFIHHGHNSPGANCVLVGSQTTGQGAVIMTNGMRGLELAAQLLSSIAKEYDWDRESL